MPHPRHRPILLKDAAGRPRCHGRRPPLPVPIAALRAFPVAGYPF